MSMRPSKTQDGHGMNDVVWFNSHSSPVKNATIPTKRWIVLFTRKAMFEKGHGKGMSKAVWRTKIYAPQTNILEIRTNLSECFFEALVNVS